MKKRKCFLGFIISSLAMVCLAGFAGNSIKKASATEPTQYTLDYVFDGCNYNHNQELTLKNSEQLSGWHGTRINGSSRQGFGPYTSAGSDYSSYSEYLTLENSSDFRWKSVILEFYNTGTGGDNGRGYNGYSVLVGGNKFGGGKINAVATTYDSWRNMPSDPAFSGEPGRYEFQGDAIGELKIEINNFYGNAFYHKISVTFEVPDGSSPVMHNAIIKNTYTKATKTIPFFEAFGIPTLPEESIEGTTFNGWYTKDGTTDGDWETRKFNVNYGTTTDVNLYAKYTELGVGSFGKLQTKTQLCFDYTSRSNTETDITYSQLNAAMVEKKSMVKTTYQIDKTFNESIKVSCNNCYDISKIDEVTSFKVATTGTTFTIASVANGPIDEIVITTTTALSNTDLSNSVSCDVGELKASDDYRKATWKGNETTINFELNTRTTIASIYVLQKTPVHTINQADMRFGICDGSITKDIKTRIENEATDKDTIKYGISICKGKTWAEANAVRKYYSLAKLTNEDNSNYALSMYVKNITDLSQKLIARAFVEVDGQTYYAKASAAYSVISIAQAYVDAYNNADESEKQSLGYENYIDILNYLANK